MSRYIEISSTYRNRNEYPLQSRFSIPTNLNTCTNPDVFNSQDPVSYQFPNYIGVVGMAEVLGSTFNGGTYINPELDPATSSDTADYYKGYTITDTTIAESRLIKTYDPSQTSVTMNLPFSNTLPNIWASSDTYNIEDTATLTQNTISVQPIDVFNNTPFPVPENFVGQYVYVYNFAGNYSLSTNPILKTKAYDTTYKYFTTSLSTYPTLNNNDLVIIRKQMINNWGNFAANAISNTIQLGASASSVDNYYRGKYLFILPHNIPGTSVDPAIPTVGLTNNSSYKDFIYIITAYKGSTKVATLNKVVKLSLYDTGDLTGRAYEILDFSYENAQNYYFSGSRLSQEAGACTDIEINSVILPNVPLKSGSRTALYPYFYLSIESANSSFNSFNSIYSNNPNSRKNNFLLPMYDTSDPFSTAFIKLDAGGMVPRLKFNPKEPLSVSITLPNGEPFETLEKDNETPLPPNPLLQITILFTTTRISS